MTATRTQARAARLERISRQRESRWYQEESRQALLDEFQLLLNASLRRRKRSIAIIGESNSGKTSLVRHFLRSHRPVNAGTHQKILCIFLNMTLLPRVEDVSRALLEAIGAPDPGAGTHEARLRRFLELAREVGLQLIFMDEFHDCANSTGKGQPFLRLIKGLMNAGLIVVPIGTEELATVLAMDPQLSSRFNFSRGRLRRITDPARALALINNLSEPGSPQPSDECVHFILSETRGIMGHLLDLVEDTLQRHGSMTMPHLRETRSTMDVLDGLQ